MKPVTLSALSALFALSAPLSAQGLSVGAARWLTSPHTTEYRLGVDGFGYGPFLFRHTAQLARRGGASQAAWAGMGTDVIVRATRDARPYLIGGAGLGMGRPDSLRGLGPAIGLWGGVGAELLTLGPLGLQAEGLYTWRGRMGVTSVSLGLRAGMRIGRNSGPRGGGTAAGVPSSELQVPRAAPADEEIIRRASGGGGERPTGSSALMGSVVATALAAMGTPYRWGGASENGFDCSGLIQYSFAQHGVDLPRRSVEQARTGSEVGREPSNLLPGDILTFAGDPNRSGEITHVGLYLGEGRFIHSAAGGVQVSVLSQADGAGRWWWERWVGVRRVGGS